VGHKPQVYVDFWAFFGLLLVIFVEQAFFKKCSNFTPLMPYFLRPTRLICGLIVPTIGTTGKANNCSRNHLNNHLVVGSNLRKRICEKWGHSNIDNIDHNSIINDWLGLTIEFIWS
jgi:hypothetical protein